MPTLFSNIPVKGRFIWRYSKWTKINAHTAISDGYMASNTVDSNAEVIAIYRSVFNDKEYEFHAPVPKLGDMIYVPTELYIGHGEDDVQGGLATVSLVKEGISAGDLTIYVSVKEIPGTSYNWQFLSIRQDELKERFGDGRAHPDPDYGG